MCFEFLLVKSLWVELNIAVATSTPLFIPSPSISPTKLCRALVLGASTAQLYPLRRWPRPRRQAPRHARLLHHGVEARPRETASSDGLPSCARRTSASCLTTRGSLFCHGSQSSTSARTSSSSSDGACQIFAMILLTDSFPKLRLTGLDPSNS